ncbi:MAG TPA: hypothetical protein VII33_15780, partial [Nakamurella sp.]
MSPTTLADPDPAAIADTTPHGAHRAHAATDQLTPQPNGPPGTIRQLAATVAVLMLALLVVAVVVHVTAASGARALLGFAFPANPHGSGAAWSIFTANLRLAMAPLAGALVLALADRDRRGYTTGRGLLDAILTIVVAVNVMIVGAGFGAYGTRMIRYTLPHGPIELAAYSCAITV